MGNTAKRRRLLIVGFILLSLVGIGGLGFRGWDLFTDQAKEALDKNSVILQHVGEIDRIEMDVTATGDAEGEDVFVFRVAGSKGTGVVTVEFVTVDVYTEEICFGTLRLSSGETYELLVQNSPSQEDEVTR
jgi:hypothetical protein